MVFQRLIDLHKVVTESGDVRLNDWPLMGSPMPTITLTVAYLYFVKILGPRLMKNRPAFDLRVPMIVYNFTMVILSTYMFVEMGRLLEWGRYNLRCQKVDFSTSERAMRFCYLGYYFFLSKFVEFADTVFFVLRKKHSQISALHVFHHSIVPITLWIGLKYAPGGNNSFFPFLNAGVHCVMYTYYGLAACGPALRPFLFWKRYLTTLQLTQFILALLHGVYSLSQGCDFPKSFVFLNLFHAVVFFYLFSNFYRNSYSRRQKNIQDTNQSCRNQPTDCTGLYKGLQLSRTTSPDGTTTTSASLPGLTITASFQASTSSTLANQSKDIKTE